jgi:hypothetical protein
MNPPGGKAMVALMDRFTDAAEACRQRREKAVDELVAKARDTGGPEDRMYWSIVYDFEHAPMTTNRRQLADRGVEVPPPESVPDEALGAELARVIGALGRMGIFFLHTDHLDDRTLLRRIANEIIDEDVRELPPSDTAIEYVDMLGTSPNDRDTFLAMYATDREREHARSAGIELPERRPRPYDRDRSLPRPKR